MSISSDDPGLMLTDLISDYKVCAEKFGFSTEILKKLVNYFPYFKPKIDQQLF